MQFKLLERVCESVKDKGAGDEEAVHNVLDLDALYHNGVDGKPLVQLHSSEVATCQSGRFLVRTTAKRVAHVDHLAAIPWEGAGGGQFVLKVAHLYRWVQRKDEMDATFTGADADTYRIAVGELMPLHAVGDSKFGYEMEFCDGADGQRRRHPSLLKQGTLLANGRVVRDSYPYAVWLKQVEGTYASNTAEEYFVPAVKGCFAG